jgi:hypothetical protein
VEKTKRVNWNEPYDFLITRPSIFGNPWSHKENTLGKYKVDTKKEAIEQFREYFKNNKELQEACKVLKGARIACVCGSRERCHGDVYVEFLEGETRNLEELL